MGTYLSDLANLNAAAPKHRGLNGNDGFQEAHGIGFSLAKTELLEFRELAGFTRRTSTVPGTLFTRPNPVPLPGLGGTPYAAPPSQTAKRPTFGKHRRA